MQKEINENQALGAFPAVEETFALWANDWRSLLSSGFVSHSCSLWQAYRWEPAWRGPLWLYICALPSLVVPSRVCVSVWGEGSQQRKWDGKEKTSTATPSVNVELVSGSSRQVCYSGGELGCEGWGSRDGSWESKGMGEIRVLSLPVAERVPAGRKGHGDGNASSEGIWGLLGGASSLTRKLVSGPVSCRWRSLHGAGATFYPAL